MIFAGLMSGTSLDGLDGALLEVQTKQSGQYPQAGFRQFANRSIPFTSRERTVVQQAVQDALQWRFTGAEPESFARAADMLADKSAQLVELLCADNDLKMRQLRAIGFHGQTVLHQPPANGQNGQTRQIGNARKLSQQTGVDVVHDFRSADMQSGGHGAPLAPAWHFELLAAQELPALFLNVGGIANLTFVPDGNDRAKMRAFDCGPGNGPVDAWVQHCGLGVMDMDGRISAAGNVDQAIVAESLSALPRIHDPASFDRWDFGWARVKDLAPEDGAATLLAISVAAISRAVRDFSPSPMQMIVGGGGRLNPTLMQGLRNALAIPVHPCEALGLDGDVIEAQAFAWLAALKILDLPGSWPGTTGVVKPVIGGAICDPSSSP